MNVGACLQHSFVKEEMFLKNPVERLQTAEQRTGTLSQHQLPPPPQHTQLIKAPVGGDIPLCITGVTVPPTPTPSTLSGLTGPAIRSRPQFSQLGRPGNLHEEAETALSISSS